ncbi:hypothetical protein ATPR_0241 [Acetobacter tropicalis NBRC 101654]|uniref:Uncharacterized protein n=1 Tax=Acetobacter tropicalis NBRC 101654 TaxID=749388 RepID=F7VA42_9PROT|nr:hypothetical protein ATPR_0241 [Acetobacter tropicalis NBRC 101654]
MLTQFLPENQTDAGAGVRITGCPEVTGLSTLKRVALPFHALLTCVRRYCAGGLSIERPAA